MDKETAFYFYFSDRTLSLCIRRNIALEKGGKSVQGARLQGALEVGMCLHCLALVDRADNMRLVCQLPCFEAKCGRVPWPRRVWRADYGHDLIDGLIVDGVELKGTQGGVAVQYGANVLGDSTDKHSTGDAFDLFGLRSPTHRPIRHDPGSSNGLGRLSGCDTVCSVGARARKRHIIAKTRNKEVSVQRVVVLRVVGDTEDVVGLDHQGVVGLEKVEEGGRGCKGLEDGRESRAKVSAEDNILDSLRIGVHLNDGSGDTEDGRVKTV